MMDSQREEGNSEGDYDIILANAVDGQPLGSLKLVGPELKGEEMIEDVVEIHLDLQPIE